MNDFVSDRVPAPALPTTTKDLLAQRKTLRTRSLNDDVEEIHLRLWDNRDYQRLFEPIWREDTIEGSFYADDLMAAMEIRKFALEANFPIARESKLAAIVKSLHVIARRYGISRKERQGMVAGEVVPGNSDSDE